MANRATNQSEHLQTSRGAQGVSISFERERNSRASKSVEHRYYIHSATRWLRLSRRGNGLVQSSYTSHRLSNSLETGFCIEAVEAALGTYGCPEIFNTDQGAQFTSKEFVDVIQRNGILFSMAWQAQSLDNIFVERFWRSVKYEDVYIRDYQTINEAREGIGKYIDFYNNRRQHQSLGHKTPFEIHCTSNL